MKKRTTKKFVTKISVAVYFFSILLSLTIGIPIKMEVNKNWYDKLEDTPIIVNAKTGEFMTAKEKALVDNRKQKKTKEKKQNGRKNFNSTMSQIIEENVSEIKQQKEKNERKEQKAEDEEKYENSVDMNSDVVSMLEHLCEGEAGDQSDECQQAVVSVVLNRVKHKKYPNTVEEVIFQKGQYACTLDGNYQRTPSERVKKNVQAVLSGSGIYVPDNVIYQAQFEQGDGVWKQIGTETFCYE